MNQKHEIKRARSLRKQAARIVELECLSFEAYLVTAELAGHAGVIEHAGVEKALDNFAATRIVHEDVLPFYLDDEDPVQPYVAGMSSEEAADLYDGLVETFLGRKAAPDLGDDSSPIQHKEINMTETDDDEFKRTTDAEMARAAAEEGKIEFAPTDRVDELESEIESLLYALDHPQAWVSDESRFCDFITGRLMGGSEEEDQAELDGKMAPLGLRGFFTLDTTLVDAAVLLKQRGGQ